MNVIVTGGAGYIGAHVCKALRKVGLEPITIDDLSTGHADAVKWGPLVKANILDHAALTATRQKYDPVAVAHLAGSSDVAESVRDPQKYTRNNFDGTATVADVFGDLPVLFASTAAIYGVRTPYADSKILGEKRLPAALVFRMFNVAGADEAGEASERHDPETHLIPAAVKALRRDAPFTLQGDGSRICDFVHVSDVADAFVAGIAHLRAGHAGAMIDICSGRSITVRDVLVRIEAVTGKKLRITQTPARPGDPTALVGKPDDAASLLNWRPTRDLDAMIATTWKTIA